MRNPRRANQLCTSHFQKASLMYGYQGGKGVEVRVIGRLGLTHKLY